MTIADPERVFFELSPLTEVVAQLKFSPILRIDAEPPASFQEQIRVDYPGYDCVLAPPPPNLPPQLKALINSAIQTGPRRHEFRSDGWSMSLNRDTFEFKTTKYGRWEQFREKFERVCLAFQNVYSPGTYMRVGLRYVDVVRRSSLGLSDVPWSQLLKPEIGGELTVPNFFQAPDSLLRQIHCRFGTGDVFLALRSGIALADPTSTDQLKETCFYIDSDFHTHGPTEACNVLNVLDKFNGNSGRLFRWCIMPTLRTALRPKPVE